MKEFIDMVLHQIYKTNFLFRRTFLSGFLLLFIAVGCSSFNRQIEAEGTFLKNHPVCFKYYGPNLSEMDSDNPFLNYRIDLFIKSKYNYYYVPGFYAADGEAYESGARGGNVWKMYFTPPDTGDYEYTVTFRSGKNINIKTIDKLSDESIRDVIHGGFKIHQGKGIDSSFYSYGFVTKDSEACFYLSDLGKRFYKFGVNSPENLLAYKDFDQTIPTHQYLPHTGDWRKGDPEWMQGKGKGLIGAINYLSGQEVNASYFISLTVMGDGDDVWPWITRNDRNRYDCSKLDQWGIVMDHMQKKGILIHFVFNETENECLLDGGNLDINRRLYYKELIARFSHYPGLIWNLGEQIGPAIFSPVGLPAANIIDIANYVRLTDPYDHLIFVHSLPVKGQRIINLVPLMGQSNIDGLSLHLNKKDNFKEEIANYQEMSEQAGNKWIVTIDEVGKPASGILPDSFDSTREELSDLFINPILESSASGFELYFGYNYPHNDINLEDFRSRHTAWKKTLEILQDKLDTSIYIY